MHDRSTLLTMAGLLLRKMNVLTERSVTGQIETDEMRKEAEQVREQWEIVMEELKEINRYTA